MRRIMPYLFVAAVAIAAVVVYAADYQVYEVVSASSSSYTVVIGHMTDNLVVINDGANEAYVNFTGAWVTTSDFELKSGESISLPIRTNLVGIVCDGEETTTLRVLGTAKGRD